MLELIHHLQAHDFTIAVTTADEAAFVRALSVDLYGVAPGRVLGSNFVPRESHLDPSLVLRGYHPDFFHDGEDKPRCVEREMGRRPQLAAGNSDGDLALLRWTATEPAYRGLIERCARDGEWLALMLHPAAPEHGDTHNAMLSRLIAFAKESGVEVGSASRQLAQAVS